MTFLTWWIPVLHVLDILDRLPIDWILAAVLWAGNYILIRKKHWSAFVVFFFANAAWAIWWLTHDQIAAMVLCFTFMAQNIWGIASWKHAQKH